MCQFFSLVSNGDGKPLYFDAKLRKKILKKELKYESADSHTSIADYFGFKAEKEDKLNKYEYNPFTKVFQIDQKNNPIDDSDKIKSFCEKLDFKTIVPELKVQPIINPFKDINITSITKADLVLLKKWASVCNSVCNSVYNSVGDSVGDSVCNSVCNSVGASVWASVCNSVYNSVCNSVGDSVGASVWASVCNSVYNSVCNSVGDSVGASVWASVGAYTSDFVNIKYKHDFSPAIKLWKKGIVPSYNSVDKIWYLHGKGGKIIWEGKIEKIK
jgi:hypothetical protein